MWNALARWINRRPRTEANTSSAVEVLNDIASIGGSDGAVLSGEPDAKAWLARLRRLEACGHVALATIEGGTLVRLTGSGREIVAPSVEAPADSRPKVARSGRKGPGLFITERNPVWLEFVREFRREHGRPPYPRELRARFPEMSKGSSVNYSKLGTARLRIVASA